MVILSVYVTGFAKTLHVYMYALLYSSRNEILKYSTRKNNGIGCICLTEQYIAT